MPRKRRNDISGEPKKPTRYADAAPRWIRELIEEAEELAEAVPEEKKWQTPKRVYLQFSKKDAEKEEQRNAVIRKRKGKRAGSGR